ncbi:MAG: hypothetical protein M3081_07830 [Gemmatimonadota bacterium]|nr:hypothetical protein [Gemmatimonadota bacterium]
MTRLRWRRIGLGLAAGAVFHLLAPAPLRAQVRDTTRRDTSRVAVPIDTSLTIPRTASDTAKVKRDTIKPPLAHAAMPRDLGVGQRFQWNRAELFASGALTLFEFVERVPGITAFRSGWIASPQHASYLGNARRVRVWYDGIELDAFDARTGFLLDLGTVPIWSLEEILMERGSDELRIYLRSWRVERTTANTRTDIVTGDYQTNLYRAFYGKRFEHGEALQVAGQQYGTSAPRRIGGGDNLGLFVRGGIVTKRGWSFDAVTMRMSGSRDAQAKIAVIGNSLAEGDSFPPLRSTMSLSYVRGAYGDPDAGPWLQVIGSMQAFQESTKQGVRGSTDIDQADTSLVHDRYIASGGFTWRGMRVSLSQQGHFANSFARNVQTGRVSFDLGPLGLSLYGEHRADTSLTEAAGRLSFGRLALGGVVGARRGENGTSWVANARVEAGLRLFDLWATSGVLRRGVATLPALLVYDTTLVSTIEPAVTGTFGSLSGRLWKDVYVDGFVVAWQHEGPYRPRFQSHEEVYVRSNWLSRFPSGHFGILASVAHEYRSITPFPFNNQGTTALDLASAGNGLINRLEIRILDATAFIQHRFNFSAERSYVPSYFLPRQTILYGVRWDFYN